MSTNPTITCATCGLSRDYLLHRRASHPPTAARAWCRKHCRSLLGSCDLRYTAGIELRVVPTLAPVLLRVLALNDAMGVSSTKTFREATPFQRQWRKKRLPCKGNRFILSFSHTGCYEADEQVSHSARVTGNCQNAYGCGCFLSGARTGLAACQRQATGLQPQ